MANSFLTVSVGISIVGNFCLLNLYEQYRLSCKEAILDSHFHPNILITLTALAFGTLVAFGSMFSSVLAVEILNSETTGVSRTVEYNPVRIVFAALLPSLSAGFGLYMFSKQSICERRNRYYQ